MRFLPLLVFDVLIVLLPSLDLSYCALDFSVASEIFRMESVMFFLVDDLGPSSSFEANGDCSLMRRDSLRGCASGLLGDVTRISSSSSTKRIFFCFFYTAALVVSIGCFNMSS